MKNKVLLRRSLLFAIVMVGAMMAVSIAGASTHSAGDYVIFGKALLTGGTLPRLESNCDNSNHGQATTSGQNITFYGLVHSNADLLNNGANTFANTIVANPEVTYGSNDTDCEFDDSGNTYNGGAPDNLSGLAPPGLGTCNWPGTLGDYLNPDCETFANDTSTTGAGLSCDVGTLTGGSDYTVVAGDNGKVVCNGSGKIVFSLNGAGSAGSPFAITMLGHGPIEMSGQGNYLVPAAHNVLAWTDLDGESESNAIDFSGSNLNVPELGILFAPRSGMSIAGSDDAALCIQMIGQGQVSVSGSTSDFGPYAPGCLPPTAITLENLSANSPAVLPVILTVSALLVALGAIGYAARRKQFAGE